MHHPSPSTWKKVFKCKICPLFTYSICFCKVSIYISGWRGEDELFVGGGGGSHGKKFSGGEFFSENCNGGTARIRLLFSLYILFSPSILTDSILYVEVLRVNI